jgi:hypothetical protein
MLSDNEIIDRSMDMGVDVSNNFDAINILTEMENVRLSLYNKAANIASLIDEKKMRITLNLKLKVYKVLTLAL